MQECSKEKDIEALKNAVFNKGEKGLIAMTSNLYDKVNDLSVSMNEIKTDVKDLLRFQQQTETKEQQNEKHEIKIEKIKKEEMINKRWRIGLTISTILGMLAIIVSLITIIL